MSGRAGSSRWPVPVPVLGPVVEAVRELPDGDPPLTVGEVRAAARRRRPAGAAPLMEAEVVNALWALAAFGAVVASDYGQRWRPGPVGIPISPELEQTHRRAQRRLAAGLPPDLR